MHVYLRQRSRMASSAAEPRADPDLKQVIPVASVLQLESGEGRKKQHHLRATNKAAQQEVAKLRRKVQDLTRNLHDTIEREEYAQNHLKSLQTAHDHLKADEEQTQQDYETVNKYAEDLERKVEDLTREATLREEALNLNKGLQTKNLEKIQELQEIIETYEAEFESESESVEVWTTDDENEDDENDPSSAASPHSQSSPGVEQGDLSSASASTALNGFQRLFGFIRRKVTDQTQQ